MPPYHANRSQFLTVFSPKGHLRKAEEACRLAVCYEYILLVAIGGGGGPVVESQSERALTRMGKFHHQGGSTPLVILKDEDGKSVLHNAA